MATGLYTWWLNYMARPIRAVNIKIVVSVALLIDSLTAFVWRVSVPEVLQFFTPFSTLYFVLILAVTPLVVTLGWFGANLTFPIERD
jgi:archaellum biogenesis ATPase FlaH